MDTINTINTVDMTDTVLGTIFGVYMGVIGFLLIIVLVLYVLHALAEMKALKILGYQRAWFAWIPFLNSYALVEATGEKTADIFGLKIDTSFMRFYALVAFGCTFIPFGGIISFVITLFCEWWVYKYVYAMLDYKTPEEESVIALFSALIGIIPIIKFFSAKPRQDDSNNYVEE